MTEQDRMDIADIKMAEWRMYEILSEKDNQIYKLDLALSKATNQLRNIAKLYKSMSELDAS